MSRQVGSTPTPKKVEALCNQMGKIYQVSQNLDMTIGPNEQSVLKRLASKYIWWNTPDEAAAMPERVIAQVMNLGDYANAHELAELLGDAALINVLSHAQGGQFNERSWAYWHYRLGMASLNKYRRSRLEGLHDRRIQATL